MNDKKSLIFDVLRQLTRSKTIAFNVLLAGVLATFLKYRGMSLTQEEIELVAGGILALVGGFNIFLRWITKKPLKEKDSDVQGGL